MSLNYNIWMSVTKKISTAGARAAPEPSLSSGPRPPDIVALLEEARAYFKARDYPLSERLFLEALEAGADELNCRQHLGRIYNLQADWPKSLQQWLILQQQAPGLLEPQLQIARAHFRLKTYGEAAKAFKAVLDLEPDHAEALQRLNQINAMNVLGPGSGPRQTVVQGLEANRAAAAVGEGPVGLMAKANHLETLSRPREIEGVAAQAQPNSLPAVSVAPIVDPGRAAQLFEQGRAAYNEEDYGRSEKLLLQALDAGAKEEDCRQHLARIYNHDADWPKALVQWQFLRDREPHKVELQLQVARALFRLKKYPEAVVGFEAVLGLAPEHIEAQRRVQEIGALLGQISTIGLVDKGRAAFKAEDYERSEQLFLEASAAGADERTCRLHLARIYNNRSDWSGALDQWLWLREREPGQLEPQLQVARALFRLKRSEEAVVAFGAVLALDPDNAEAQRRLRELGVLPVGVTTALSSVELPSRPAVSVEPMPLTPETPDPPREDPQANRGAALLDEARMAFKAEDYAQGESLFLHAMEQGADEAVCRLHLARIYNQEEEWTKALEQWKWLRDRDESRIEPQLQVGRAQLRLGHYGEAENSFRNVLALAPDHPEAGGRLQQAEALKRQSETSVVSGRSWLSLVPQELRLPLARDALLIGIGAIESAVELAVGHGAALGRLVEAYGEAEGDSPSHRQLYSLQAAGRIEELAQELKKARSVIRVLGRRTSKLIEMLHGASEGGPVPAPAKFVPHRFSWRESGTNAAVETFRANGFEVAALSLLRNCLPDQRSTALAEFGAALQEVDRSAAVRAFWLAFGANPTPFTAERMAFKMFQSGDLTNASALAVAGPVSTTSPVVAEMRSTIALFRDGIEIPVPAANAVTTPRVAYVASGSLPFQVAGYTVRTQQMLTALARAGVDCACFTRPGYPWDRPRAHLPDPAIATIHEIDQVTYVHSRLPDENPDPERLIVQQSDALESHFRSFGCNIVQAASNSRNALPALIAARRVGARFIYEMRGLWELTAASRFSGWEHTERYAFDRKLEMLVASHADHVLTITEGVASEVFDSGISRDRVSLLPNAVDPDLFRPLPRNQELMASLAIEAEDFVVVYAGSLSNYEGLDDLIVAMSLLRQQGARPKLVIAGDGLARRSLEVLAINRGMSDRVIFAGRVKPDDVTEYIALADVVALPRKPFKVCEVVTPLKPFEAMSMGKALIVSDLAALREIVTDGVTGLLCRPADPADLAHKLKRLMDEPVLRDRLGGAAREWTRAHRSWSANADTLVQLYGRLSGTVFPQTTLPAKEKRASPAPEWPPS